MALAKLKGLAGVHLVIVRYNQYHVFGNEWVYNRADIDRAKVVWARDMGDSKNAELIRYFPHRRVWLAEPDLAPPRFSPYPVPKSELGRVGGLLVETSKGSFNPFAGSSTQTRNSTASRVLPHS